MSSPVKRGGDAIGGLSHRALAPGILADKWVDRGRPTLPRVGVATLPRPGSH